MVSFCIRVNFSFYPTNFIGSCRKRCKFLANNANMLGLESFVYNYPLGAYAALFLGMFIEGEVFFLTAAIFAWHKYLNIGLVLLVTFIGTAMGDVLWYFFGRYFGETKIGHWFWNKFKFYHDWLAQNFVSRYWRMAFYSKFIYYINRLTILFAGWHKLTLKSFFKIQILAITTWLSIMFVVSYFLSLVIGAIDPKWILKRMEFVFIVLIIVFIGGEYLLKRWFSKKITE